MADDNEPMGSDDEELDVGVRIVSWIRFSNKLAIETGQVAYEWEDLQESEQDAWRDAFTLAEKLVAEADGVSYAALARQVFDAYHRTVSPTGDFTPWDALEEEQQLRWKFLIRHAANLLLIVPEEDGSPQQHEDQLLSLFQDHLRLIKERQTVTT